jgi:hypothetical protein
MVQPKCKWESDSQIPGGIIILVPPNVKDHRTVIIAFLRVGAGAKLHLSRGSMHPLVGQV